MIVRPGSNLLYFSSSLIAVALLTFISPYAAWLGVPLVIAATVILIREYLSLKSELNSLTVERSTPFIVGRNVKFVNQLIISNSGVRQLILAIRDGLPPGSDPEFRIQEVTLGPKESNSVSTIVRIPTRGRHHFGPVWIRLRGLYGLLDAQKCFGNEQLVKVFPEQFSSREHLLKDQAAELQMLDKLAAARMQGAGTEFESMSEYREGDDPRRIDWRTSARYRRPIVKRFRIERHRDLLICIDCGRLMAADSNGGSKLDHAVDSALQLARVALQGGDRCGASFYDDRVKGYLPPNSGPSALRILVDHLFDLKSEWRESDFTRMFATLQRRHSSRSLIVVLSDISDAETTHRFRQSLARLTRRHVVIFVALQTPSLVQTVAAHPDSLLDGFRIAVAHRLRKERDLSLQKLRRSGVHVLDVMPCELTIPLINQYIDLRTRNLL